MDIENIKIMSKDEDISGIAILWCKICDTYVDDGMSWNNLDEAVEIAKDHTCNLKSKE